MVFISDPDTDSSTPKDSIRVPEHYPPGDDKAPFDPKDNVQIRTNAQFDQLYEIYGEPLGEGKFGKVFQCRERSTGLVLAAKLIKIRKEADKTTVEREVAIMTKMRHPRIAQIYDAFYAGVNDVILVMEIVRGGELFNRVAEESYILTEKAVAIIIYQLCEAIDYMHSQDIIHLDIKPENIMCVSETGNSIKLIDFGLAQSFDPTKDLYLMAGTPEFAAPEVIKYEPLDYRTDMWSVGVITYILLSGYSPFLGDTTPETYVNVERGEWAFTEEFDYVSKAAKDFITRLLSYDKSERMLPSECLKHDWLIDVRKYVANDKALNSAAQLGPILDHVQLRRYVLRRRFRKIGLVVRTCVQMQMRQLAKARVAEEMSIADTTPETSTMEAHPTLIEGEAETPVLKKKKKKTKLTVTEKQSEKKPKRVEPSESSKENASMADAVDHAHQEKEKTASVKKRIKADAQSMATSSTEMPALKVKKSSASIDKRSITKSPSPALDVRRETSPIPIIYEELARIEESDCSKTLEEESKKKKRRSKSSDRRVVERNAQAKTSSSGLLLPVDAENSLTASTTPVEETHRSSVEQEKRTLAAGKVPRRSGGSGSLIGVRIQQLTAVAAPQIVLPPPATVKRQGEGKIEAMKKRLWKQELLTAENRKTEEVIVVPKAEKVTISLNKKESPRQSASKILPVVTEKTTTTTKVTTTKLKRKKQDKESGIVMEGSKRIEHAQSKLTETQNLRISETETRESQEESISISEDKPKKTVKKAVLKKSSTTAFAKKTRTEASEDSPKHDSSLTSSHHHQQDRLCINQNTMVNDEPKKESLLRLRKDVDHKISFKTGIDTHITEDKPNKSQSLLINGKEKVSVSTSNGRTGETMQKTISRRVNFIASTADGNADVTSQQTDVEETSQVGEKPKKKKVLVKKQKTVPIGKAVMEYPVAIASDIEMLKATRGKAKAREAELNRRVRFAFDEDTTSESISSYPREQAQMERTLSEDEQNSQDSKNKRRTSFFEVTEDEHETLAASREDFSFSTLKERLERQLTKRNSSPAQEEPEAPRKELIRCPSTNSLLKKWRNIEQTNY